MRRVLPLCTALLFASGGALAQSVAAARADAHEGRFDAAVAALKAAPKSAEAQELLCSLYSSVEQRDAAIDACAAAAAAAPSNSDYALQLARSYGDKADHSGALTGMRMVGRIRDNFERAVQLNGNSVEALSDLGEFYVQAPGVVGGGTDKARPLVARLQPISAARAHRLAAMIAAKDKDDATAVREYQAAIAAGHTAEAYVDLAKFYRSRKQYEQAAANARLAIEHDPHHGPDTLDAAALLFEMKRDTAAMQAGLRAYLSTPQTGVASFARAHTMLGQSLAASGDSTGAQKEYADALALAHDYEPARKAAFR